MKIASWIVFHLPLLGPSAFAEAPVERPPVILSVGEQRLVRTRSLARYSPGGDAIRAVSRPEGVLIKGVKPGGADLWIWDRDGHAERRTIRVEKPSSAGRTSPLAPGLALALGQLDEVEILYTGEGVVLRGEYQSLSEAGRVQALARAHPKEIRDEALPSVRLLEQAETRLREWLNRAKSGGSLQLERMDRGLRIRGSLKRAADRGAVERQIRAIFAPTEIDLETLPDDSPTVHFKVFLLELKKSRFSSIGLGWPSSQPAAFRVSPWAIRDQVSLEVALQAMEGDGSARVLSNPELAVRAPGEAELFAGGEIPIRTHTQYSSDLSWKSYGLGLKLKVTHVAGNRVRVDITTEVSHLDERIGQDQIPGLQANRMKTQVDARFGEPLLLSGLLQQGTREQARGLPLLRSLPVLGKLFGSEDYLNERSELVAILLPQPAPPIAPMHRFEEGRVTPAGPAPLPRNWIAPEEERRLRASVDFPWNAFR